MASFSDNPEVRPRLMPHDSIFYRSMLDVEPDPNSDVIIEMMETAYRTMPYIVDRGYGQKAHDKQVAEDPGNALAQPGFYINEMHPATQVRTLNLNKQDVSTLPRKNGGWAVDARYERMGDIRVQGGHAASFHTIWGPIGFMATPFMHGTAYDTHYTAFDPARRKHVESITFGITGWDAGSGTINGYKTGSWTEWSMDSNEALKFPTESGIAAGSVGGRVPATALTVTGDEVQRGWINHMLMLIVWSYPNRRPSEGPVRWPWPAQYSDGEDAWFWADPPGGVPIGPFAGHVLRLKQSFDISGFRKHEQVVLRALKEFGAVIMDKSGGTGPLIDPNTGESTDPGPKPGSLQIANHPVFDDFNIGPGALPYSAFDILNIEHLCAGDHRTTWASIQ